MIIKNDKLEFERKIQFLKTVTICESVRFSNEMKKIAFKLESNRGYNVLQCTYNEFNVELTSQMFDNLKKAIYMKIDFSDIVYVVDVDGDVGKSVKKEIEYANAHKKEVLFYGNDK